jgi:hypothetical protein
MCKLSAKDGTRSWGREGGSHVIMHDNAILRLDEKGTFPPLRRRAISSMLYFPQDNPLLALFDHTNTPYFIPYY